MTLFLQLIMKKVEWIEEESFFKLSEWENPLLNYYEEFPNLSTKIKKKEELALLNRDLKRFVNI